VPLPFAVVENEVSTNHHEQNHILPSRIRILALPDCDGASAGTVRPEGTPRRMKQAATLNHSARPVLEIPVAGGQTPNGPNNYLFSSIWSALNFTPQHSADGTQERILQWSTERALR
jgi:hypothetical protein